MLNVITDRTQADVDRLRLLQERMENGTATLEDISEWSSASAKGAYNYTDLNRVGRAFLDLQSNYAVWDITITYPNTPKTNFTVNEKVTETHISQLLANLRVVATYAPSPPGIPSGIKTIGDANTVEQILLSADQQLSNIVDCYQYSGDAYTGGY